MGVIWKAHDRSLKRDVAVKVLAEKLVDSPTATRRFLEESQITGQLQHPGIPAIYEIGELPNGLPFLAMKLIEGRTLTDELTGGRDRGSLVAIFEQIAHAVAFAHSRGVIHRDLKPSNVMVGAFGEVQVMDWGLAKHLRAHESTEPSEDGPVDGSPEETRAGSVLGTPAFMPPEQAAGDLERVDRRADVFGLGGILCVMLTGKPPYVPAPSESTIELAAGGRLENAFARLDSSGADPELIELAKRCLAPMPSNRPADAEEVATTIRQWRSATEERAREAELARARLEVRSAEERKRRRVQLALALSLFAIVGIVAVVAFGWQRVRDARAAEKTARFQQLQRDVQAGIRRMDELLVDARSSPDNPARQRTPLLAARGELDRIESAVAGDEVPGELGLDVVAARTRWETEDRNTRMLLDLEEIRFAILDVDWRKFKTVPRFDESYLAIFRAAGLDPFAGPVEVVGKRIREHPLREIIQGAMTSWKNVGDVPGGFDRLEDVIRLADPIDQTVFDPWRELAMARSGRELAEFAMRETTLNQSPRILTGLAGDLEVLDQRATAIAFLTQVHLRHPEDFWTNANLAEMHMREAPPRFELAVRYATAAVACRPDSVPAMIAIGSIYSRMDDHKTALIWFRRAAARDPTFTRLQTHLADALAHVGDPEGARIALEEAIRERPDDDLAHLQLAEVRHAVGDVAGTIESLVAFRELIPDDRTFEYWIGLVLRKLGDGDARLSAVKALVAEQPKSAPLRYLLGRIHQQRAERDDAVAALRQAVEFQNLSTYLAELALALGSSDRDFPIAKKIINEATRRNRRDSAPYYVLGCLHRDRREYDEAMRSFKTSVELWPRDERARKEMTKILGLAGKKDDELEMLREWRRKSPRESEPFDRLTKALLDRREFGEGLRITQDWLKAQPRDYGPYDRQIAFHRAIGDLPSARIIAVRKKEMIERQAKPVDYILRDANDLVRTLELEIPVDEQLKDVLAGKRTPADAAEWLALALHAHKARRHERTATEFFRKAFAADNALEAGKATTKHRLSAAEASLAWMLGQSWDGPSPAEAEWPRLRKDAHRWLRSELDALRAEALTLSPNIIRHRCSFWINSPTLKEFRMPANAEKLSGEEKAEWDRLWSDLKLLGAKK